MALAAEGGPSDPGNTSSQTFSEILRTLGLPPNIGSAPTSHYLRPQAQGSLRWHRGYSGTVTYGTGLLNLDPRGENKF